MSNALANGGGCEIAWVRDHYIRQHPCRVQRAWFRLIRGEPRRILATLPTLRRQRRCLTTMPANDGDTYTHTASRRPPPGASPRQKMGSRWTAPSQLRVLALRDPSGDAFATKSSNVGYAPACQPRWDPQEVWMTGLRRPAQTSASPCLRSSTGLAKVSLLDGSGGPLPGPSSRTVSAASPRALSVANRSIRLRVLRAEVEPEEHSAETRRVKA